MFAINDRDRLDAAHRGWSSAHRELLAAVTAIEESGLWRGDGAGNLPAWLSARYQVSYATAREWVESARALASRPALDSAYAAGSLSAEQMKAIVTLSAPGCDEAEEFLEGIEHWDVADLQREARKAKARQLERSDEGRYLSIQPTPDERFMRIKGQVHFEEGALLMKAVDRAVPEGTPWQAVDAARLDGLLGLARAAGHRRAGPRHGGSSRGSGFIGGAAGSRARGVPRRRRVRSGRDGAAPQLRCPARDGRA